ncbi:MAG: SCO family protein [Planctomycetaceae bacterium]|nr:SCO family protein [Planctomycetales bacterium]MCB9927418.1 SCO family protein [Planctomycetaceae bacterium]
MSRTGIFALAVALLAGGVLLISVQLAGRNRMESIVETKTLRVEKDETPADKAEWLTEYTLTERSGKQFDSHSLDGKVHVVNFFFTACPTACPLQTQKVQELDRDFGPSGVHFLSITCDPDTDTPAVLQQYAKKYGADPERWVFLTGDFAYIRRVAAEVYWSPLQERGHREDFVVVDKWGKVRGNFPWNHPEQIIAMRELLSTLIAETEPPSETISESEPQPEDVTEEEAINSATSSE